MKKIDIYTVITPEDKEYPRLLKNISSPPKELYCFGDISLLNRKAVGIVGSRKVSEYGKWVSYNIGKKMGINDIVTVSGMAAGADTYVHLGTMDTGGKTIAVLGCGIDRCYPAANWKLKDKIAHSGLVISEYPPKTEASRWTFPKRNRIISGLSEIIVVTEAGLNSGALITAELAAEQGKTVVSVPGNINSAYNIGSNKLITEGAVPIATLNDILDIMGIKGKHEIDYGKLGDNEAEVLNALLQGGEMSVDDICSRIKKKPNIVNGLVTVLEMKGLVYTSLGKVFVAK